MNLSSDFFIRMVGAQDGFRVPVLKPKVEDSNCLMTIKISGDHQNFVDISRCEKLSSTFITRTLPHACPNILHLDISYTRADELSTIYSTCIHLKTLNIAGLSHLIPNLQGIQRLRNLEALTLRSSNIDDIRALEELYCLRSLDLGCMHLKKVGNALKEKERLEELLLDETQFTNEEAISDILDYLGQLPLLKLMNITKSDLFKEFQYIQDQIPIPVYYEPKTRRELFFRALAVNNVNEAYFFISCGQDINAKIEKNDEKWLSDIWIDKCYHQKTRLQTPFFIFHPIVEEIDDIFTVFDYFPNGLHLTLFFNAFESAQMLLANNIDQEEEVYISDVLYEKTERILYEQFSYGSHNDGEGGGSGKRASAFLLTSSKSMKNMMIEGLDSSNYRSKDDPDDQLHHSLNFLNKKIYSIKDYIHYLYQKNVHRFTENLINKKVSNWKSICDRYKKRLLYLIDCYDMKKQIVDAKALRGNDSFNIITLEEMDKRKSFAINFKQASTTPDSSMLLMMDVNSRPTTSEQPQRKEDDGVAIGKISNLVHQSSADSRKGDVISAAPSPSPKKLTRGVSFANFASVSIIAEQPTDPSDTSTGVNLDNFDPNQLPILQMMKQHQEKLLQGEEMNFPGGIGDEEEESLSSKDRPNILPSKPKLFNWNQHGLVNKIIGEPKIYKTVDEEAVKKEAEDAAADALFNNWMMNALPNTSDEEGKKSPKSLTRQLTNNAANAPLVKGKKRLTKLDRELAEVESFSEMMMKKNNKRNNNEKEKQELPLEISLLGKKTFWLESKKKTIEEAVMKREESEIYPPIGHKTLFHQKKTFLTNLKLRLDQKVHDNILKTLGKDGKKPTAKAGKLFS